MVTSHICCQNVIQCWEKSTRFKGLHTYIKGNWAMEREAGRDIEVGRWGDGGGGMCCPASWNETSNMTILGWKHKIGSCVHAYYTWMYWGRCRLRAVKTRLMSASGGTSAFGGERRWGSRLLDALSPLGLGPGTGTSVSVRVVLDETLMGPVGAAFSGKKAGKAKGTGNTESHPR